MKYLKAYRIPFSGLALGKHDFSFDIDKKFFDCFEYSIVKDGVLRADVTLDKQATMMIATFRIQGTVRLTCDVCLSEFDGPIESETSLIIKFNDEELADTSDEILVLSKNDYEFSIADILYEYINVAVPSYVRCDEQAGEERTCDSEMINVIKELAPPDSVQTSEPATDPRWEMLKKLRKK